MPNQQVVDMYMFTNLILTARTVRPRQHFALSVFRSMVEDVAEQISITAVIGKLATIKDWG